MDDRIPAWYAVALAVITGLSTFGAAYWTAQQTSDTAIRQYDQQLTSDTNTLRRNAYATFLQVTAEAAAAGNDKADEKKVSLAEARVLIIAGDQVRSTTVAKLMATALNNGVGEPAYEKARASFISEVRAEVKSTLPKTPAP